MHTAESKFSNVMIVKLGEIETKFENSEIKNRGKASCGTLPLLRGIVSSEKAFKYSV